MFIISVSQTDGLTARTTASYKFDENDPLAPPEVQMPMDSITLAMIRKWANELWDKQQATLKVIKEG